MRAGLVAGPDQRAGRSPVRCSRLRRAGPAGIVGQLMGYRRLVASGVIAVIVLAWYAVVGLDPIVGHVTSYSATCLQLDAAGCARLGRTLDPSVFKVSVARQQVELLTAGGARSFESCTVTSKRDWHCRSLEGAVEFGFSAGRPWHRVRGSEQSDLVFVSRLRYLWLKSGEADRALLPMRFQFRR
jgi:hypothetical protein